MEKKILTTTNYDLFKKYKGNRTVTDVRKEIIKDSIYKYGWITNPILVSSDYEIIDGQGRFAALKELGLPIEYIIDDNIKPVDCMALNANLRKWNPLDYIHFLSENGNEDYRKLEILINKFKTIPTRVVINVCYGETIFQNMSAKVLTSGFFKFNISFTEAYNRLETLTEFMEALPRWGVTGRKDLFISMVNYLIAKNKVKPEILYKRLDNNYHKILPFSTVIECLSSITAAYNHNSRNKVFWATDYEKEKLQKKYLKSGKFARKYVKRED